MNSFLNFNGFIDSDNIWIIYPNLLNKMHTSYSFLQTLEISFFEDAWKIKNFSINLLHMLVNTEQKEYTLICYLLVWYKENLTLQYLKVHKIQQTNFRHVL